MRLSLFDIQCFDAKQEVAIRVRHLPHWSQAGTVCFITWRTHDSIPAALIDQWRRERADWLSRRGIHAADAGWRARLSELPQAAQIEYHRLFTDRWNEWLDSGHGRAVLRDRKMANIVGDSPRHFDGDRYLLTAGQSSVGDWFDYCVC